MNLGINNNYNPAFTAKVKFNYDGGKTQKGTWAEVAKIVEAKQNLIQMVQSQST